MCFLLLPAAFLLGLALVAIGKWPARWPSLDLNDPAQRATAILVFVLTIANVVIVSLAAYRGVEYMDSVAFCGQVCHMVMKPEFVGHQTGPHANVRCVDCHVAPGASGFVASKTAGTRRLLAELRGNYPTPIVPAPRQLPTAKETCEQCHSPQLAHGDRIRDVVEYADNEKNAASTTKLTMHVGVIHRHNAKAIEFVATDKERQTIPYVRVTDRDGRVREFAAPGTTPEQLKKGERRRMDCTDCHNRPSHVVAPTAERAVNDVMARGGIPLTLPFVHRESVKALNAGRRRECRIAARLFPIAWPRGRPRRRGRAGDLRSECISGDEGHLRQLSQQHRSHRCSRMLSLSRRRAHVEGRREDRARLRDLSCHRVAGVKP